MKSLLSIVSAICALLVILCTAIEIPTFSGKFYISEYEKYNIPNSISVSIYDLTRVTARLQDYMKNKAESLDIDVIVAGEYREFFNNKEKQHMVDVKNLFTIGFYVRNIVLVLFFLTSILLFLSKTGIKTVARAYLICFCLFLLVLIILVGVIALDFDTAFTMFHKIFFTNDLWLLDPSTDLLINIMPLEFFIDISKYIAGIFIGVCAAIITGSSLIVKYSK